MSSRGQKKVRCNAGQNFLAGHLIHIPLCPSAGLLVSLSNPQLLSRRRGPDYIKFQFVYAFSMQR